MIIAIIMAILALIILLFLSATSHEIVEKKNQEIAKLERLRRNDAWEIDFMEWNVARLQRSEGRAVEEYQKLSGRKIYCVVRGRGNKMTVSVGYMVGYRCEVLPLGFIIDLKGGTLTDKSSGVVFPIYE